MVVECRVPMSHPTSSRAALTLAALGVVFGDIGTSPLYALRECFHGEHGIAPTPANVMGVLSLIFWALVLVISVKYVSYVMRADNHGEGGDPRADGPHPARRTAGRTAAACCSRWGWSARHSYTVTA